MISSFIEIIADSSVIVGRKLRAPFYSDKLSSILTETQQHVIGKPLK